jgi:hypothetical protein
MVEKLTCENDRQARTDCNALTEEGLASFAKPRHRKNHKKLRNERVWNARNLRYLPALERQCLKLAYIRHGDRSSAFLAF